MIRNLFYMTILLWTLGSECVENRICKVEQNSDFMRCLVSIHNKTFGKDNLLISKTEAKDWAQLIQEILAYMPVKRALADKSVKEKYGEKLAQFSKELVTILKEAYAYIALSFKKSTDRTAGLSELQKLTIEKIDPKKIDLVSVTELVEPLKNMQKKLADLKKNIEKDKVLSKKENTFAQEILSNLADFILTTVDKVADRDAVKFKTRITELKKTKK